MASASTTAGPRRLRLERGLNTAFSGLADHPLRFAAYAASQACCSAA